MSEDNSDEENEISTPARGTASRGNPFVGSTPDKPKDNRIVVRDPNGPVRVYELNDNIKETMEGPIRASLDRHADWYEIWWEGTEMVIEFEGKVRKPSDRQTDPHGQSELPRNPQPPWMPRQGMPQAAFDLNQLTQKNDVETPEAKNFDEGMLPVHDFARIDIQDRADKNPLKFEDILVMIDEEPIDEAGGGKQDVELDIDDFRDMTDGKETVDEGARGNRYNL